MKHYWWLLPLLAVSAILGLRLPILEYVVVWFLLFAAIMLVADSVEKGTREKMK